MSLKKPFVIFVLTTLCFVLTGRISPVQAEHIPVDPRVREIIQATGDYLSSAGEFTFHAEITYEEVLSTGQKIEYANSVDAAVKRPDKIRTVSEGDLSRRSFFYDGKSVTLINLDLNLYATAEAPSNIDDMLEFIIDKLGFVPPIADLFYSDINAVVSERIKSGFYAGLHSVNGVKCHHLVISREGVDSQVWIEAGKQLVVRKFVLTYEDQPGAPEYTAVLSDWDLSPRLPDLLFKFVPPEGAMEIDFQETRSQK